MYCTIVAPGCFCASEYEGIRGDHTTTAMVAEPSRPRPEPSFKSLYVHISFIGDGELSPTLAAPECTFIEDEIP